MRARWFRKGDTRRIWRTYKVAVSAFLVAFAIVWINVRL
jgi:hypothetical protein